MELAVVFFDRQQDQFPGILDLYDGLLTAVLRELAFVNDLAPEL